MAITVETRTDIIELIVGMVGAAPGAAILSELADIVDGGLSLNDLAIALANNPAFKVLYPSFLTSEEFATNFLTALMGAEVDATTLSTSIDAMVADLNAGTHRGAAMYTAITTLSATAETDANFGAAAAALNNKTEVAIHYSVTTQQSAETLDELVAVVSDVTSDDATVTTAKAAVDGTSNAGSTFTLTTGSDNIEGGAGNDIIFGANGTTDTFTTPDIIQGGGGTDRFNLTLDAGGAVAAATVSGVENWFVRDVGAAATIDFNTFSGETAVWNDRSTSNVTFNNIASGGTIGIKGDSVVTVGTTTFKYSSTSSPFNMIIDGGVKGGNNITNTSVAALGATITSSGAANTVGTIQTDAAALNPATTLNANADLTATAITGHKAGATLTITGAHKVSIGTLEANVDTVSASGLTGNLTLVLDAEVDTVVTSGSGDDTFTTGAVLTTGSVAAGSGTDTLIVANTTHVATSTLGGKYTGFETLQVNDGVTIAASSVSGITAVKVNGAGSATGLTGLSATQAGAITLVGGAAGVITLGVSGAGTVGQIDTVNITANDGSTTTNTLTLTAPVITDVEKLVLNAASDNIVVTALTSAEALSSITITGGKTTSVTSGNITVEANTIVDGSAATGALTLDFGGIVGSATTAAMAITGGSKGDTITASGGAADLINGGDGIDIITITKDGTNTGFVDVQSDAIVVANADRVVGFVTAENDFDYNGALSNGTGAGAGISAAEVASAATITLALATADAGNDIVFIATTDLTGAQETALDTLVATTNTTNAEAAEAALLGTGGALNGAIANLDTILSGSDSVLFQFSTDSDTFVYRITNSDTATTNTLTSAEVELVGIFQGTADLAAGDYN